MPTFWLPKLRLVGLRVTVGAATTPVPVSGIFCGLSLALSAMLIVALRAPLAEGENVTLMAQEPLAANVLGLVGQVFVWPKSAAFAPFTAIPVMVSGAAPVLVSVTVWEALVVPTFWLPKLTLDGDRLTTGAGGMVFPEIKRFRTFAVIIWLFALAKPGLQSQKPSLNPLSTPHDHSIVPAEKTVPPAADV